MPNEFQAFVMMPISNDPGLEDVYTTVKRVCAEYSIGAFRADEVEHTGKITEVIIAAIRDADVLIADLSQERPNVYYELGFSHGQCRQDVHILAKEGTQPHFDIKDYNIIFYRNLSELDKRLKKRLRDWKSAYEVKKSEKLEMKELSEFPDYITGSNIQGIRRTTKVRELEPLEEDLPLHELPDGVYGFTVPWMLNSDPTGIVGGTGVEKIALHHSSGGTGVMEVHKASSGAVYFIAYMREEAIPSALGLSPSNNLTVVVAFSQFNEFPRAVAIPVSRIKKYRLRHVRKYDYVADLVLR